MVTGTVVGVVTGTVGMVSPPLPQAGAPPIPHLPKTESEALTGPDSRSAFDKAAMGRRIVIATVRRAPIWPASAE